MSISDFIDKVDDFDSLSQIEQVKLVSYFYCIVNEKTDFTSSQIRGCFVSEDLKVPNVAQYFPKLITGKNPTFVKKGVNYTFHRTAKKELDEIFLGGKHTQQTSITLRTLLPKLTSDEQRLFLEEAVICFEIGCYRASIIMTWLLTIDALYELIINSHLAVFNTAIQVHGKYKKIGIIKKEDFSEIKESDFIELLRVSKIISNDIRKILDEKLGFRNTAAHPNTIVIKEQKAISFIDDLIENVVLKIQ